MKKHKAATGQFVNLTSLVDVVSMNVGILIILAVFMALLAVFSSTQQHPADGRRPREGAGAAGRPTGPAEPESADASKWVPQKVLVPWSHPTSKQTLFFVMREGRVQFLDLKRFYQQLLGAKPAAPGVPVTVTQPGLKIRFFPISNQVYCLELNPEAGSGETPAEARRPGSRWQRTLADYPREDFVYFFWVAGDSFEGFRDLRRGLWERQVEVGWKPVLKEAPLEVCNGFEGSNTFQPQ